MSQEDIERSPEAPEADAAERYTSARADDLTALPVEANDADAVEQHTRVGDSAERWPESVPVEADEADAADQHLSVRDEQLDDEDDYR
jgi:hypothetical protein